MTNSRSNTEIPDARELTARGQYRSIEASVLGRWLEGTDDPGPVGGTPARRRRVKATVAFLLVIAGGLIFAYAASDYVLQLAGDALTLGIACMGLDFLVGYTGRVSFGQAAWLTVGGFFSGYLFVHGWDVITATAATVGLVVLLSGVMGAVATMTGGLAFAIITLAEGVLLYTVINHLGIFGAGVGLFGLPLPKVAGQTILSSERSLYLLAFVLAALSYLVVRALTGSPAGRFCQAVRDDETRARSIGVEIQRHQVLAFIVASVISAVGGIAFVVINGGIAPAQGEWDQSGLILVMLIIGGVRSLYGGFIGAFIYVFAQNYLTQSFANSWQVYLGALFVILVLLLPGGIVGGLRAGGGKIITVFKRRDAGELDPGSVESGVLEGADAVRMAK
jgi:branched-chain amino acid transport system permease protein